MCCENFWRQGIGLEGYERTNLMPHFKGGTGAVSAINLIETEYKLLGKKINELSANL